MVEKRYYKCKPSQDKKKDDKKKDDKKKNVYIKNINKVIVKPILVCKGKKPSRKYD